MTVLETLQYLGDRIQIAMVVGSTPTDGSGDIRILYANSPACFLFKYDSLEGKDIRDLMPQNHALSHRQKVNSYVERDSRGAAVRQKSIMGSWRNLEALCADGQEVPVAANVADIKNSEERYFVAMFKDRSDQVRQEKELAEAMESAKLNLEKAENAKKEADELREKAESALLKEKRLTGQISLLRQIFGGTVGLVALLGILIVLSWYVGADKSKDALAMIERVLLVMTGILGSAMASVFDSRNSVQDSSKEK
jgi:PAS domain S-box-containing protein